MYMATPLAIMFLLITAAWTGIFAIAFARQRPAEKRSRLADCFWIGVPALCIVAVVVLLVQARAKPTMDPSADENAQTRLATHRQECIRDSQTQQPLPQGRTEIDGTVQLGAGASPTLKR
jgi:hypothetical protein